MLWEILEEICGLMRSPLLASVKYHCQYNGFLASVKIVRIEIRKLLYDLLSNNKS